MKKVLITALILSSVSLAAFAKDTYWRLWCDSEQQELTNYSSQAEARKWGSKHVLATGHTVTWTEHERGSN